MNNSAAVGVRKKFPKRGLGTGRVTGVDSVWRRTQRGFAKVHNYLYMVYKTTNDPTDVFVYQTFSADPENYKVSGSTNANGISVQIHEHAAPANWSDVVAYYRQYRVKAWKLSAKFMQTFAGDSTGQNVSCITKPVIMMMAYKNRNGDTIWPSKTVLVARNYFEMKQLSPCVIVGKDLAGGAARAGDGEPVHLSLYTTIGAITDRTKLDMHNQLWHTFASAQADQEKVLGVIGVSQFITDSTATTSPVIQGLIRVKSTHWVELTGVIPKTDASVAGSDKVDDTITGVAESVLVAKFGLQKEA